MLVQNPLLQPWLVLVQRKIPVLGRLLHQWVAGVGVVRVDQLFGRKGGTALLALVAVSVQIVAARAFATDVAVGEELTFLFVVELLALHLHELAVVVQLAEEICGKLMVGGGGGAAIDIEGDAEVGERLLDDVVVAVHHVLRGATLFLCADGHRHSVLVASTDEQHFLAFQSQIARINVGWHIHTGKVADMNRTVCVGKGGSDEGPLEFLFHKYMIFLFLGAKLQKTREEHKFYLGFSKCK